MQHLYFGTANLMEGPRQPLPLSPSRLGFERLVESSLWVQLQRNQLHA